MSKKLGPKTIILTGGGKGIGAFIARYFYEKGDHILIGSRSDSGLAAELGSRARFQTADVANLQDHRNLVKTAIDWTGKLDVYINNAGFSAWRPLRDIDDKFLTSMLDTNLKGVFWGCQAAASGLKPGGTIINISSLAGKRGSANNSAYCASKFGVNGLTQALAKELGVKGIRVNAVCPVYVKTKGLTAALADKRSPAEGKDVEAYLSRFAKEASALGRLPTGQEVAALCYFLSSDEASGITGQCINVDCGVLPG